MERLKIHIKGIVQGVGFRPFVYNLARQYSLNGWVNNDSHGVHIEVEGEKEILSAFLEDLKSRNPPLSKITEISYEFLTPVYYKEFKIEESLRDEDRSVLISPDISICDDCLRELFDPSDRRFRYPFINCTNCGPRYTIVSDIPYDRERTSMKVFPMCSDCSREYHDPSDRRFHAQPDVCPGCGPAIELWNDTGKMDCVDVIENTVSLLKDGKIVAIKGLGGFHLAVDASKSEAVSRLRQRKGREEKPFALMSRDIDEIRRFCHVTFEAERVLESPQRPIVLMKRLENNRISDMVAPGNKYFGVMLPYTPLHYLIFGQDNKDNSPPNFTALVMTSGNLSEEPICIDNQEAMTRLKRIADYFLLHNRDIYLRCDDSIVRVLLNDIMPIRRSRGFVPMPVILKHELLPVLGCGAELKNTLCLTKGRNAFLSQHIGDLEDYRTLRFFEEVKEHMEKILQIKPVAVAYDMHPEYLSTKYALSLEGIEKIPVQHHHAHLVSCLAEHYVDDSHAIGVICDGTGYGTDGNIWGGEFLVGDAKGFQRVGHLKYTAIPGGIRAIKEPWRMALAYLIQLKGDDIFNLDNEFIHSIDEAKTRIIINMIKKKINSPLTSSLGRLFDGVSAILGLRHKVSFEGQAAMELEMAASENINDFYSFSIERNNDIYLVDPIPVIAGIIEDISQKRLDTGYIAAKFMNSVIDVMLRMCHIIRNQTGINIVVLSGGVFQNVYLLERLIPSLRNDEFITLYHKEVPPNDGGISLGQVIIANEVLRKGGS